MTADVQVTQLRLRTRRREDVAPVVTDLEDALKTATLPGRSASELIFIRRLDLGRIRRGTSRQSLARRLEARLANCRIETYQPGVQFNRGAEALAFPDLVVAALAVLTRGSPDPLRDQALAKLFGPCARAGATPEPAAVLSQVLALGGPAAAGRLLMLILAHEELGRRLIDSLSEAGARELRRRFASRLPEPSRLAERIAATTPENPGSSRVLPNAVVPEILAHALTLEAPGLSAPARRQIARAVSLWGLASERALLIVELLTLARAGPTSVPAVLKAVVRAAQVAAEPTVEKSRPPASGPAPDPVMRPRRPGSDAEDPQKARARAPDRDDEPAAAGPDEPATEPPADPAPVSQFAGLVLFLRLFRLLDLERAEEALDLPLCAPLMASCAARLGVWEDDPLAEVFAGPPVDPSRAPVRPKQGWMPAAAVLDRLLPAERRICRPLGEAGSFSLLTDPQARMVLGCAARSAHDSKERGHDPSFDALVHGASLAIQRLARRLTGQGWRKLALRPARVLRTNTHLDVFFSAELVDVAIRLAGLDIDPGWVPWMGRVVTIHYDYSQPSPYAETRHLTRPWPHE